MPKLHSYNLLTREFEFLEDEESIVYDFDYMEGAASFMGTSKDHKRLYAFIRRLGFRGDLIHVRDPDEADGLLYALIEDE